MTTKEAFEIVRTECNRRAVSTEIPGPENLPALSDLKFFEYDAVKAKEMKKGLISEFNALL